MGRHTIIGAEGESSGNDSYAGRPNIAFAGLTAAGKTTHARLLAEALDYKYVSATKILLEVIGMNDPDQENVWFDNLDSIQKRRTSDEIDDELERRLLEIAIGSDGLVLDTWAMPWICKAPMIRLWLESDRLSRTWKCFVSQGANPSHGLVECSRLIDRKDLSTRSIFLRRHKFDLLTSRGIFDVVLENTWLIEEPTRASTDRGIAQFHPVVLSAVRSLLAGDQGLLSREMANWSQQQRECLRRTSRRRSEAA
ncbi:cytidylate kinase family protein [Kibdelosporangium phytohabitans]|uniref:cytidylate kinase family protein n=1 Tax=Kibdelosporangium phytohabitans TaxID=860235 RepID=UPI000A41D7E2|nr:cytidylate kinase family protein [Kibdelosporangium phytohabitans]MBE1463808.1 cytidylate kinase [Kibdelosporangium phytohabitans]